MFPQIQIRHNVGNIIEIPNEIEVKVFTYLSANAAIGATTLNVDNAVDFDSGNILLLLSSMGAENCEFVTASAHTDTSFTVGATKQAHSRGESAQQTDYDQISIYKSATIDGTYTLLSTQTLNVTQQKTIVFDPSGTTSDYYKVQWKNSITSDVSSFSDPISVLAYPSNSAASLINPVLTAMGVSENDPKITTTFCLSALNDARKFVDAKLFGIRQDWREAFEVPIQVLAGTNFITLPSDVDFQYTDRSILAARFIYGNVMAPFNLRYIDKRSWNQIAFQLRGGTTASAVSSGTTTIPLNSAGDFPTGATGVAYVATDSFDQTIMEISYTDVDYTTNELTGVTGVTRDIPAGTQVWSTPSLAQPLYYTVFEGKLWFDRVLPDSLQGNNCYIDYYKALTEITDLYQAIPENYREMYKFYLRFAIKYRKDITLPESDPDLVKFNALVDALFNNLYSGQRQVVITS